MEYPTYGVPPQQGSFAWGPRQPVPPWALMPVAPVFPLAGGVDGSMGAMPGLRHGGKAGYSWQGGGGASRGRAAHGNHARKAKKRQSQTDAYVPPRLADLHHDNRQKTKRHFRGAGRLGKGHCVGERRSAAGALACGCLRPVSQGFSVPRVGGAASTFAAYRPTEGAADARHVKLPCFHPLCALQPNPWLAVPSTTLYPVACPRFRPEETARSTPGASAHQHVPPPVWCAGFRACALWGQA
jgi:hypothetical protein